jgi:hypothetical protein
MDNDRTGLLGRSEEHRLTLKREARFHAIEDRIWSLIEEDVKGKVTIDRNRPTVDRSDANF